MLIMLLPFGPAYADNLIYGASGASWVLDIPNGVLTIYGNKSFSEDEYLWHYKPYIKKIVIEEGVIGLGFRAFADYDQFQTITIPDSVQYIGECAFEECTSLKTVSIGSGVKSIEASAFSDGLTSLQSFSVSSGNKTFCTVDGVVYSRDKTEICIYPQGRTQTSYNIPDSVKIIRTGAFSGAANLKTIQIGKNVKRIETSALSRCTGLKSITIPNGVEYLSGFYECSALESITIPNSVTHIGECAFYNCTGLKSITIPNSVTDIDPYAFHNCPLLKSIVLPDSVTSIHQSAFSDCSGLQSVIIPDSVTSIDDSAFSRDTKLTDVYYYGSEGEFYQKLYETIESGNQQLWNANWHYVTKPEFTAQPKKVSMQTGNTAKFSVAVIGKEPSYQWYYSKDNGSTWTLWSGKTDSSLSVKAGASNNGCLYRCEVTNSYGSVNSNSARLIVTDVKPTISGQPADKTVASGKTAAFKAVASGSDLSYQWLYSKNNGSSWTLWSGKTSASLSITAGEANNGCLYRCEVTNSYGSVTSKSAKLTVSGVKPKIMTQPEAKTIASGKTASFKVFAAGSGLSYQWYYSKNNGSTWTSWSGKTSATLSVKGSETNNGYLYRCEVTNTKGSVTSNSAKLTVSDVKPKITSQPAAKTVATGKTATFKVVAAGSGLSYQWQYSKNNGSTWTSWSGKTSATLSLIGSETNNGYLYRCVVKNSYGSVTSSSAKLTVSGVKPKITVEPANQTVASGKAATFKVVAAGTGLTYQWQYSKNNGSTWTDWNGKTSASLSLIGNEKNDGYQYRCVVSNAYGTVCSHAAALKLK